jgi:DNA-binding XRE family transcriptional regulator
MMKSRKKLGLTQAEFAWLIGVHEITVSKWERKILDPTSHQKMMISCFEKSNVDDLDVPTLLKTEGPVFTLVKILTTIKEISDNL